MKNQTKKRGFTIVELVIVIAVIAILASILITTFSGVIKNAHESADKELIRNVNQAMNMEAAQLGLERYDTMHDAVKAADEGGYNVPKIKTKSDNNIAWNRTTGGFVLLDEKEGKYIYPIEDGKTATDQTEKKEDFFVVCNSAAEAAAKSELGYSVYAAWKDNSEENKDVTVQTGFDAGDVSGIKTVTYTNAGDGQNVVIRTNGGTLNIGSEGNVAKGQQFHYGIADEVNVYTETTCFHETGKVAKLNLFEGKAIAEEGASLFIQKAASGTVVEKSSNALVSVNSNAEVEGATIAESSVEEKASIGYIISSKEELLGFRDAVNNGTSFAGITVKLGADIDMSGYDWLASIGTKEKPFIGSFDGQNHKITNLSNEGHPTTEIFENATSKTTGEIFGLFGYVTGKSEIKNIEITVNAAYGSGKCWAGAVASNAVGSLSELTLENITVRGSLIGNEKVAGIIGQCAPYSSTKGYTHFINCKNYANVVAASNRGAGICGAAGFVANGDVDSKEMLKFINCENYGNISCGSYGAGICGNINMANSCKTFTYENCKNGGILTGTITYELFFDVGGGSTPGEKANLICAWNNSIGIIEGHEKDWESVDKYGFLAGQAYDTNLTEYVFECDNHSSISGCHFNEIGKAINIVEETITTFTIKITNNYRSDEVFNDNYGANVTIEISEGKTYSQNINYNQTVGSRKLIINGAYNGTITVANGSTIEVNGVTKSAGTYTFVSGVLQEE